MDIKNNNRFRHTAVPIFLWLVLSFSILQYIYSVVKLPFRAVFEDFGHFYYYSRALEGFERQKDTATSEQIFYTLLGEAVNPPYKDQNEYYRQEFPHAWGSAVHSPIFYILLRPLAHLKYFPAAVLWLFFNQILLVLAILFCILGCPRKRVSLAEFTAVIFMAANFLPLQMNNLLGQTSIIIFFLISWAFYNFERKKDILSGLSLGLAVLFRWYPALLIIYFVFKRQFRVVFGSLLTVAIGFAISIWRLGLPLHIIQMKYMPSWYFQYTAPAMNNLSLSGFFYRLLARTVSIKLPYPHNLANTKFIFTRGITDNHFLANLMVLLFSLIFLIVSFCACRKITGRGGWKFPLEFCLFVTLLPILATCVTVPFMPVLLFVYILLFLYLCQADAGIQEYLLFILSYILIGSQYWLDGIRFFWQGLWVVFLSGKLYGAIILWFLVLRLLRRYDAGHSEQ